MIQKVAITGGNGFLGWHVRCALQELGIKAELIPVGELFDLKDATRKLDGSDLLIHIAGANRGESEEVLNQNVLFAKQLSDGVLAAENSPRRITFANSSQIIDYPQSAYAQGKLQAAEVLRKAASSRDLIFQDVVLPNLFGEGGKPFYNSVTSTFCHLLASGEEPKVIDDKELRLMHAQDAADQLIRPGEIDWKSTVKTLSVSGLLARLRTISEEYQVGQIPNLSDSFSRSLFNTYRSYRFPENAEFKLERKSDNRGSLFEIIRTHGGSGQSSFSTTFPGISRGEHYHRRKVERFTVLSGQARISLRRMFSQEVIHFDVDESVPTAIDMPTLWAHKITNTGSTPLFTAFWVDEFFNPEQPDTIPEVV